MNAPWMKPSRWGNSSESNPILGLIGVPPAIVGALTQEQLTAYQTILRIEEISHKLRSNQYVPAEHLRSPSPAPEYDNTGRRVNSVEIRYRTKMENERHRLVEYAIKTIPGFKAPSDYRRPSKTVEKVYIPAKDYPEVNFIGLLLGPRGNTLRKLQEESGARIAIRGRGSVKEGKDTSNLSPHLNNLEDDLHVLITCDQESKIRMGVRLVNEIIEKACFAPLGQNELKRGQLRELAVLNGTLRMEDRPCPLCNEMGHRKHECPKRDNLVNQIVCHTCGAIGHVSRDCTNRNGFHPADDEIDNFMKDLSGEVAQANPQPTPVQPAEEPIAPWRKRKMEMDEKMNKKRLPPGVAPGVAAPDLSQLPPPPSQAAMPPPPGIPQMSAPGISPPPPPPPGISLQNPPPPPPS